jgi:hypothetical protein
MVLTCAMPLNARQVSRAGMSRRSLLAAFGAGAVALGVGACTTDKPPQTATAAASTSALGPLYTETLTLIGMYDQAIATSAPLTGLLGPLREETRQHAIALAALMSAVAPSISAGPSPSGVPMPPPSGAASPTATVIAPSATPSGPASGGPSEGPSGLPSGPASVPPSGSASSGPSGSPSGSATLPVAATRATLMAAEKTAQANATTACLTAPSDQVAVLASIAASRATHVAALA